MYMYANEVEIKEKEKLPEIKNLLRHNMIIVHQVEVVLLGNLNAT